MFTPAPLHFGQTSVKPAVAGGMCVVVWHDLRTGTRTKQGFRHFPNLPQFGSEAEQ